jgi:hypothetical protein
MLDLLLLFGGRAECRIQRSLRVDHERNKKSKQY